MRDMPHMGIYTNRSRGIESRLTVPALLLMETTISVSVRKLGSVGRESVPMSSTLTVPLSTGWAGTAVGLGVTTVAPASGVMLKAPSVGSGRSSAVGVAVASGASVA